MATSSSRSSIDAAFDDGEKTPVATSAATSNRASPTLNLELEDDGPSPELKLKEAKLSTSQLPALESQLGVGPSASAAMKRKATLQFATLCLSIYVSGWNDGALGPLLPRLQAVYEVSTTMRASSSGVEWSC